MQDPELDFATAILKKTLFLPEENNFNATKTPSSETQVRIFG